MPEAPVLAPRFREALALHRRAPVIDAHADSALAVLDERRSLTERSHRGHFDVPRAREGGLAAVIQTAWPHSYRRAASLLQIERGLAALEAQVARAWPAASLATTAAEVRACHAAGRVAVLLSVEAAEELGGDVTMLAAWRRRGVRVFQPVRHHPDGAPAGDIEVADGGGLTAFGRSVVTEANRLGLLLDVSHLTGRGLADALALSAQPVAFTHAGCRTLVDHPHNLADDQLRALAERGGVVGIAAVDAFLTNGEGADYRTVADHIDHAVQLIGPAHVGLGSDFDGTDRVARGLEDVSRLPNITAELLARGYDEAAVTAIIGGNWLRLFEQVFGG